MRAVVCALALTVAPACLAADSPITNGGFETLDARGNPVDWELLGAAGDLGPAELTEGTLRCAVSYQPPQTGFAVVCNISRPEAVGVNGVPATEVDSPAANPAPCWRYLPDAAMVELRLEGSGRHEIELTGVAWQASELGPRLATELRFEFDAGADGWRPSHDLDVFTVADGVLRTRTTGPDPYMVRSACHIDAATTRAVRIRMALEPGMGEIAQLFWATADDPAFDEGKSVRFSAVADGKFHELLVPVGEHARWTGTITGLRLDPTGGQPLGRLRIDFVHGE